MAQPTNRRASSSSLPLMLTLTGSVLVVAMLAGTAAGQLATTRVLSESGSGETLLVFRDANYSGWEHENVTYRSSTGYNAKGMAPLYKIANQVISVFVGKTVLPDGYIEFSDDVVKPGPKVEVNDWSALLKHYWALILVVLVCGLLAALMPIIGFCFCCCRCAGACGGRSQPFDKKHDTCRRVWLGFLLILAGTGLIFGVVVAFATNAYLHQGVGNATVSAREAVEDSQKFLRTTSAEANHLLNQNYKELNTHLTLMLQETADFVIDRLAEKSQAVSLTQLAAFVDALPHIKANLTRMRDITKNLRVNASQLSDGLRGVKRKLLETLQRCPSASCKEIMSNYLSGKLDINGIDYNQLPDMTETIDNVNSMASDEKILAIRQGQHALDNMRETLNVSIAQDVRKVQQAINEAGKNIQAVSFEMTNTLERISDVAGNNSYRHFDIADRYVEEFAPYHLWAGLAVSAVLLVVLMCVVCGLLCGICGKRPDGYGDDCCNKGAGSRFLMCGVAIVFLTISALIAIALAYFLAGIVLQRGICIPLKDPVNDPVFRLLDSRFDLNAWLYPSAHRSRIANRQRPVLAQTPLPPLPPLRVSQVIDACHHNESIYKVIRLESVFDINTLRSLPEQYHISEQLNELIARIQVQDLTIWTEAAGEGIAKLRESALQTYDVDKTLDNLNDVITSGNLSEIAEKLTITASDIPNNSEMADIRTTLRNEALHLRSYQDNLVDPMTAQTAEMRQLAVQLDETLKFNRSSFGEAMKALQEEIIQANEFISVNGTLFVKQVARDLTARFLAEITAYLEHVIHKTKNELGRCAPMSNVYNSLLVAGCNRVVDPFNGFWAGVAWCILLFLPTIVISVKLSTLYQKSDPYPGPLVESEYLYDAYSERDNIPLANAPKNKRRNKKNERRRSSRDRRGDYYEDSGSPHHGSGGGGSGGGGGGGGSGPSTAGGSRDTRYNDMALNATRIDNVRMFVGPALVPMPARPSLLYDDRHQDPPHNYLKYYPHWNGGPPRYQNPPMAPPASEYERPPPYYFPGAPSEGE